MAVNRYYSNTAVATTLSGGISNSATVMVVGSVSGFPVSYPYTLVLDRNTASEELVQVSSAAGTTLTVVRGVDSTTAVTHSAGAAVEHSVSARDFREPQEHIDNTTTAHGVSGAVVGTTSTQTLTNKTMSGSSNTFSNIPSAAVVGLDSHTSNTTTAHGVTGAVVGTTNSQTLINKTISGASNTLSAIPSSAVTGLDTHTAATAAHGATGAVVGTTNTQTLINKTLTSPTITNPTITGGSHVATGAGNIAVTAGGTCEIILGYSGGSGLSIAQGAGPVTHPNGGVIWWNGTNLVCRKPGGGDVVFA